MRKQNWVAEFQCLHVRYAQFIVVPHEGTEHCILYTSLECLGQGLGLSANTCVDSRPDSLRVVDF